MIEENMIKDVRNLFRIKMEIDDTAVKGIRNLLRLKKNNGTIKDRVIRDIRNLFEYEKEDYYKQARVDDFGETNILNMKVTVIETKHCKLKNILIKSDHI